MILYEMALNVKKTSAVYSGYGDLLVPQVPEFVVFLSFEAGIANAIPSFK